MTFGQILLYTFLAFLVYSLLKVVLLLYKANKAAKKIRDQFFSGQSWQNPNPTGRPQKGGFKREKDITDQSKVVGQRRLNEDKNSE